MARPRATLDKEISEPKSGGEWRVGGANSTADRALDVLLSFSDQTPIWSASDLAARLQMPRSTLYRYLNSLRGYNLIAEDQSGRYRLGAGILQLARIARLNTSVLQLALPHMRSLEARFGEIVILKERVGYDIVNLESLPGRHRITLTATRSQMLPWPAAPSAKLFTAYAEPVGLRELQRLMRPVAFTSSTVRNLTGLKAQMKIIRERGYALAVEEMDEGVGGIAVPIFQEGRCRYSISMAAPIFRLSERALHEVARAFRTEAQAITVELENLSARS
jgi:DNA-binding IclR family transcriptional regulator